MRDSMSGYNVSFHWKIGKTTSELSLLSSILVLFNPTKALPKWGFTQFWIISCLVQYDLQKSHKTNNLNIKYDTMKWTGKCEDKAVHLIVRMSTNKPHFHINYFLLLIIKALQTLYSQHSQAVEKRKNSDFNVLLKLCIPVNFLNTLWGR